jgi:predicted nucleic acid-binding Zn ribbon protein
MGAEAFLLGGTAVKALGEKQAADAAAAQIRSQQQAAMYDATIAQQNAQVERQQAGAREELQRRRAGQVLGEQRAAFAQAGTGTGGSAADVMAQSLVNAELDALTLRYEGEMRARGQEIVSTQQMAEAAALDVAANNTKKQGRLRAVGTILGGTGSYMEYGEGVRSREASRASRERALWGMR